MQTMNESNWIDSAELGPLYPYHVEEIKARHERALEKAGAGHVVVFSGAPKPVFLDDYYYPFRANPHFVGWVPLTDTPHSYLVYTPGEVPILVYYQEQDYWHSPPGSPDGYWAGQFDVRIVHSHGEVAQHLPPQPDKCILIGEIEQETQAFGIERINPGSAINMLHYARGRKTSYELACMRAASRRAARGHIMAEAAFRDGQSEFDIHFAYCRAVEHTENALPYGNIVALNENSAMLHYQHQSRNRPADLRSFLIDAGANVHGYASDITRTYSYQDSEYRELLQKFDSLQRELVAEVRTGIDFAELHLLAHRKIAQLLLQHKFVSGSPDALLEAGVTAAFYPHGLGHLLGIQVHDMGGFMLDETGTRIDPPSGHPFLRLTRKLEAGQVLTIEPGLYVIDMLQESLVGTPGHAMVNQERVDWLRPFGGIRVEDNVRVLDDGCENLTRDAFALVGSGTPSISP